MLTVILSICQIYENIDRKTFLDIKNKFLQKNRAEFEKFKKTRRGDKI